MIGREGQHGVTVAFDPLAAEESAGVDDIVVK